MATRVRSLVAFSSVAGFLGFTQIGRIWLSLAADTTSRTVRLLTFAADGRILPNVSVARFMRIRGIMTDNYKPPALLRVAF
jgi:hypothetical protein